MKLSAVIALLILAAALLIGIRGQRELGHLRVERDALEAKAAAIGIGIEPASGEKHTGPRLTRLRADRHAAAVRAARRMIEITRVIDQRDAKGTPLDPSLQDDILEALQQLQTFDTAQLHTLLDAFRATPDLTDEMRGLLLGLAVGALAERDPRAALALLTGENNPLGESDEHAGKISHAISHLARTDPDAALAWIQAHPLESIDAEKLHVALIEGAAHTNLRVAAGLMEELDISDRTSLARDIAANLDDASQCAEWIDIMRASPGRFADADVTRSIHSMGAPLARMGFENGRRWIAEHLDSPGEIQAMVSAVAAHDHTEQGRWIEWAGENLPEAGRDAQIETLVGNWTSRDHRAAGEWLAALPDGPAKSAAVAGFAKTVAPYEPSTAAAWALTLPPGNARNTALREVYQRWPRHDPARNAFMAEHPVD